jgi:hypothetical protein
MQRTHLHAAVAAATTLVAVASGGPRDLMSDTWMATDGIGRELPGFEQCGPPKANRTVGIFYFLWLGSHGTNLFDISRMLAANPENPAYGPPGAFHWWGEPHFGHYRSDDPWVIRRHAQMLSDAGVDALAFDVTNAFTYDHVVDVVGRTYSDVVRESGRQPPRFFFLTHTRSPAISRKLLDRIHAPRLHEPFWFPWKGRPLLLADLEGQDPAVRSFFTIRESWAWTRGHKWFGDGRDRWPWLDHHPQTPGWHDDPAKPEHLSVCVAQHPVSNIGRSFHADAQPPPGQTDTGRGPCFAEQMQRAIEVGPEFLFITGWNEWVVQRFVHEKGGQPFLGRKLPPGGTYFVDAYNQEFSRDIEPMRGGHADNYYYQMVAGIRLYKGVRPRPRASPAKTVRINADFSQWSDVGPEYLDDVGDTKSRDFAGWGGEHHVVRSGRNDFDTMKVARDATNLYFHVRTRGRISDPEGTNWMVLLLNTDCDARTGWCGYDVAVNRSRGADGSASIERNAGGWSWSPLGTGRMHRLGDALHVSVPRSLLGPVAGPGPLRFDFKWCDHVPERGDPTDFIDQGDTAPNGRFRYRYEAGP